MRQALTIALQGFQGAVVLVSHDRELIANVCDELFLVHDGQIDEFEGDISDYGKWLAEKRKQENAQDKTASKKKNKKDSKKFVSRETTNAKSVHQAASGSETKSGSASSSTAAHKKVSTQPTLSKEEQRKLAAEQRKLTAPVRRDIENTEKTLAKINEKLNALEDKLADTSLYEESRKADLMVLLNEQTALQQQHSDNEEQLLQSMTTLEEMEANFE